jgi:hypothetical protein
MKPLRSKTLLLLGLCLLVAALGCARKKAATAAPPPPVALPEATPAPQPQEPAQTQTQTSTQGTPPPNPDQGEPANEDAEKAKAKNGKAHSTAKRTAPPASNSKTTESAHNVPPRTVVKPEGTESGPAPGTISPSPSQGSNNDQATTEQLLQNTETNLTGIKRQFSKDEEAMVSQIKDWVGKSRQAIKDNDLARARTLANKAHELCDELMKRR